MGGQVMTDKAGAFAEDAKSAGWKAKIVRDGIRSTVIATREKDGAVLSITWKGEACLNESTITIAGRTKKLRNASACREFMTGGGEISPKAAPATKRHKITPLDDVDDDEPRRPRPIPEWGQKHCEEPDPVILKSVVGRTIRWVNDRTGEVGMATVPKKPRHLKIELSPVTRRRALTFAAVGEGFRSVYIERIVDVS